MAQTKASMIASRVFLLGIGLAIAIWLYFVNVADFTYPFQIQCAGLDITKHAVVVILIFVGVIAGAFIKYGFRGGQLSLS